MDNLLESQKSHGDTQGIGYGNRISSSLSSHINFIKSSSHSKPSPYKQNESQTFKVKRSQVSNTKVKSNKTQSFMTQKEELILGNHNLSMLTCTLDTIIIGMLHNIMYVNMLYKPIKIHIAIVNVYLRLYLKRVIESINHHNTQGMFHTLGKHIILG